jgi:aminoglycoside 3-N-acetyltransferase
MLTGNEIKKGLLGLGLKSGDSVMVHSSLKSLGYVDGAADAVVDAILDILGPDGTLLVPTSVFDGSVTVFLRQTAEVDLRTAPSLLGKITETVRLRTGSARSIHPSHPVAAIGRNASELLSEHHLGDSPAGKKSPYGKLARMENGRVLLIGVSNNNNTMLHTAEEYYTPYIFSGEEFNVNVISTDNKIYRTKVKGYCVGVKRKFTAIDPFLLEAGYMRKTKIGNAEVTLIDAPGLLKVAEEKLKENPNMLLDTGLC